jgi:cellulose synthase/poly-beta-1,6-N-acetylglucosamine synthase-like glycosyltransferase
VARGRNLAIEAAKCEIIASTDIGCEWDPEWLEELVEPLFSKPEVEMVAGSWAVKFEGLKGPWAPAEWALKGGKHESVAEAVTFASSRSIAYRKEVWQKIGGYAEDLTLAGDDTVFGHMMNLAGVRASAAPRIRCYWHRHESLKGFLKENRRNFIGDGEAMLSIRHFLLVGGRLVLEWMSALTGVFFILLGMPTGLVIIVFLPFVFSNLLRMKNWIKSSRLLASYGITYAFPRVVFFDIALRIYGLVGFMEGFLSGIQKCASVRGRIKKLKKEESPEKPVK